MKPEDRLPHLLVLGGARSGKSAYAMRIADARSKAPVIVATAQAGDAEMAARIARHRAERAAHWRTVEEPLDLVGALAQWRSRDCVVVVDCLTLWLSNLMLEARNINAEFARLGAELRQSSGDVILVSNEVGLGLVPETPLGRDFRDAQGWLNQAMARVCDDVVFMAAGLPLRMKPQA